MGVEIKATLVVERCMGHESCDCLKLGLRLILHVLLATVSTVGLEPSEKTTTYNPHTYKPFPFPVNVHRLPTEINRIVL